MELGYLKLVKDWQMSQKRAAVITGIIVQSDEQMIPGPIPVRKGLYLDVDEILRRSVPSVSQLTVLTRDNKETPLSEARSVPPLKRTLN